MRCSKDMVNREARERREEYTAASAAAAEQWLPPREKYVSLHAATRERNTFQQYRAYAKMIIAHMAGEPAKTRNIIYSVYKSARARLKVRPV